MPNLRSFFFIIIFFLNFINVNANENIGFIDIDFLLKNSNLGKSITSNLVEMDRENLKILESKKKKLIDKENAIKKVQNIVSKEELNKKVSLLKEDFINFNKEKEVLVNNFNEMKNLELTNFFSKINPLIQNYMDKESIKILFEKKNIFIGSSSNDITQEVLKIINSELN